jgi:hypothetical protein
MVGRNVLLSLLLGASIGAITTYFFIPPQIKVETQIVEKIRVVEKEVATTRRVVEVKKPDGTTVTSTTDKVEERDIISDVDKRLEDRLSLRSPQKGPNFGLSIVAGTSIRDVGSLRYGLQLEYRVLGPFWIQAFGLSDLSGGVGFGVKF